MEKSNVINMFCELISGKRDKIQFSKGYEVFEEVYDEIINGADYLDNKKYNLERTEDGIISIITIGE